MTKTYELGALRVTVDAPSPLSDKAPLFTIHAKSDDEFAAVVEMVGGPGAFSQPRGDYAIAYSAEGLSLLLYAPRDEQRPPDQPAIRRLLELQQQAQEPTPA